MFECRSDVRSIQAWDARDRSCRLINCFHNEARDTFFHHFRYRAAPEANHRRPTRHRLDHDETKWLGPIDGEQQSGCLTEEASLFVLGDLTEILDVGIGFYHWTDSLIPIGLIDAVHLRRDLQRHARPHSDFDCAIWPLFWGDAAKEGQIAADRF